RGTRAGRAGEAEGAAQRPRAPRRREASTATRLGVWRVPRGHCRIPWRTVPGDMLDLVLIVLAVAFAVAGDPAGFIIGILSFTGFICGAVVGVRFAHGLAVALATSQNVRAVLAIIIVFVTAVGGMLLASALGVMIRSRISRRPTTVLDAIGGAVVNV